ncbi:YcgL domain-containing protein [Thiolapillus sp.]
MELELHPERRLARANAEKVLKQLAEEGYYLQMPPDLRADIYHGNEA